MFKLTMLKKNNSLVNYDPVIMPAQTITIDKIFKFKNNDLFIDPIENNYLIAWFDRSKNIELFDDCNKVYFGLCNIDKLPLDFQNLSFMQTPDDVDFLDIYSSNQSFNRDKMRELISDYVNIFNITNLINYSDFANDHTDITHPDFLSVNSTDLKIGVINSNLISKHSENMLIFAWTIKHSLQQKTENNNIPDIPQT
jgi:hypothetical protein